MRALHLCASCNQAVASIGHARTCPWYGIDTGTWPDPPPQLMRGTRHSGRSIEDVPIPDVLMPAKPGLPERPW